MKRTPESDTGRPRVNSPLDAVPAEVRGVIHDCVRRWAASQDSRTPDHASLRQCARLARARGVKSEYMVVAIREAWYELFPRGPGQPGAPDLARAIDSALGAYFRDD
jgi:hypothetical protein